MTEHTDELKDLVTSNTILYG